MKTIILLNTLNQVTNKISDLFDTELPCFELFPATHNNIFKYKVNALGNSAE